MLGYQGPHNDIYVFFEDGEVDGLEKGVVEGAFVNHRNPTHLGDLLVTVDDGACRRALEPVIIKMERTRDRIVKEARLTIMGNVYAELAQTGSAEPHLGWSHIFLYDVSRLTDITLKANYGQFKAYMQKKG
ncbi:hypothetical protein JXB02_06635 [Candidatus Woesearchaeota archaeon]|nr:hypothetical protein [Candidatus Woesearchaeota archaeon]